VCVLNFFLLLLVRGVKEGWFPEIVSPSRPSQDVYGTCMDILHDTIETKAIIHPYPWIDPVYWRGSLVNESDIIVPSEPTTSTTTPNNHRSPAFDHGSGNNRHFWIGLGGQLLIPTFVILSFFGWRRYRHYCHTKAHYVEIA